MSSLTYLLAFAMLGCSNADNQREPVADTTAQTQTAGSAEFSAYWHQGKAELTRYTLEQARYGEIHKGDAVLIFVTEDFISDKQVKLESEPAGKPVAPILKLNLTKKFYTGVYPYSMMTSVFTPVDIARAPHSLKVTTTSQEWCGHTFTQFNFRGNRYEVANYSYFEREGDQNISLDVALLEDEIWNRIRLAPGALPTGDIKIVPSTMSSRLRHIPLAVENARATLEPAPADTTGAQLMRYTIAYANPERTLAIDFEKSFPHRIMAWSETYRDGFGPRAELLTTRAIRTHSLMLDYWSRHLNADSVYRTQLGLEGDSR